MIWCKKEKFPYYFLILLTQRHDFPAPKLTNFHIFVTSLSLNVTLFSTGHYMTAHIKINYETGCIDRLSEKKNTHTHKHVFRTIVTAKMEKLKSLWH